MTKREDDELYDMSKACQEITTRLYGMRQEVQKHAVANASLDSIGANMHDAGVAIDLAMRHITRAFQIIDNMNIERM